MEQANCSSTSSNTLKTYYCGYESPSYLVIRKTKNYELREYGRTVWVGHKCTESNFDESMDSQFWTLFQYIQGKNSGKRSIPMTSPVVSKVSSDFKTVNVNFYVPQEYQNLVASLAHPKVQIRKQFPFKMFVRPFVGSGFRIQSVKQEMEKFLKIIEESRLKEAINPDFFFVASYDGPFASSEAFNEIWFPVKSEKLLKSLEQSLLE